MKKIFFLAFLPLLIVVCCCSSDEGGATGPSAEIQLFVSPEQLKFTFESGTKSIVVTSNVEWAVSSDQSWCKSSLTGGLKGKTALVISVEKNNTTDERTATLSFKSGSFLKKYMVIQTNDLKVISIPDLAFKTYCIANFDTDKDGEISQKEGIAITSIDVSTKGIATLLGIEQFTSLTTLNCRNNNISLLDVSSLKLLNNLNCSQNKLSELNIRTNINMLDLNCTDNPSLGKIYVWTRFQPTSLYLKPQTAVYVEPEIPTPAGYILVWQDEFNDSRLSGGKPALPNTSDWWYETGNGGWGNNEIQNYVAGVQGTDTCAVVTDGTLKIIAKKIGSQVLSIRVNTTKSWTYGYFEARLKLPQGKGTWPAFWMMPKNFVSWPDDGEIDIMEEVGYRPNYVSSSIHCKSYYHGIGTQKTAEKYVATAESDFHVYAVEWTEDYIWGFIDGESYFKFPNDKAGNKDTWPFNAPFYLKLNLAWGGNWGGAQGVDESKLPATYEIDYVRVFQKQ